MREVGIGIAGFGTVGGGVLSILRSHAAGHRGAPRRADRGAARRRARPRQGARRSSVDRGAPHHPLRGPARGPGDRGGGRAHRRRPTEAFDLVRGALERGKHVVTANKALLAARGDEIFRLAREKGVDVYYEAAVCGGVPVIRTLREALASDRINALHGIVNGTTNFILTAMAEKGEPIEQALAEAQRLGYAEADPTLDVSGGDAAQKLCVLAQLAFGARLRPADVLTEGIMALAPEDFRWGREFGYALKLLAVARRCGPAGRAAGERTRSRRACTRPSSRRARCSPACAAP